MNYVTPVAITSSLSFLIYGVLALSTNEMKLEFKRYGVERIRPLIGALQILGGLCLLVGLQYNLFLRLAALGLALMMLVAMAVRFKIGDRLRQAFPALILFLINMFLFLH